MALAGFCTVCEMMSETDGSEPLPQLMKSGNSYHFARSPVSSLYSHFMIAGYEEDSLTRRRGHFIRCSYIHHLVP